LNHQNNYVECLSIDDIPAKSFNIQFECPTLLEMLPLHVNKVKS